MNENKINNNEPLDIKFKDKKKDKKSIKPKDGSYDLLSSDGDSYLRGTSIDDSEEKEDIDLNTSEFDIQLDTTIETDHEEETVNDFHNDNQLDNVVTSSHLRI